MQFLHTHFSYSFKTHISTYSFKTHISTNSFNTHISFQIFTQKESLRTYLQELVEIELYAEAYNTVREAGVSDSEVSLTNLFGDRASQLLPLFQLLVFLEDLAEEAGDYDE